MARGHVPDRVPARLPRGNAGVRELSHHIRHGLEPYVIELYVLPRGEVHEAARVLVRDVGQSSQLVRSKSAVRYLDALHLHAFLALGVCAQLKTYFLELDVACKAREVVLYLTVEKFEFLPHNRGKPGLYFSHRLLLDLYLHECSLKYDCRFEISNAVFIFILYSHR